MPANNHPADQAAIEALHSRHSEHFADRLIAFQDEAYAMGRALGQQDGPAWIAVSERLPECPHECTTDDAMVSDTLLVTDARDQGSLGMGHMRADGTWKLYGGDYDFMHPEQVTHWMPLPPAPGSAA